LLATLAKPFEAELAERLQHPVTRLAVRLPNHDEGLVDERQHDIEHVLGQ